MCVLGWGGGGGGVDELRKLGFMCDNEFFAIRYFYCLNFLEIYFIYVFIYFRYKVYFPLYLQRFLCLFSFVFEFIF